LHRKRGIPGAVGSSSGIVGLGKKAEFKHEIASYRPGILSLADRWQLPQNAIADTLILLVRTRGRAEKAGKKPDLKIVGISFDHGILTLADR